MGQLDPAITRAYLAQADELPAAETYVRRNGMVWIYDDPALRGELRLRGPAANDAGTEEYVALVDFDDYRALPPWWCFVDPRTKQEIGPAAYPQPVPLFGGASVFHTNGVICAPWNRGAYVAGLHSDWTIGDWEKIQGYSLAHTVPDMIDRLYRETSRGRGRMAPLPEPPRT